MPHPDIEISDEEKKLRAGLKKALEDGNEKLAEQYKKIGVSRKDNAPYVRGYNYLIEENKKIITELENNEINIESILKQIFVQDYLLFTEIDALEKEERTIAKFKSFLGISPRFGAKNSNMEFMRQAISSNNIEFSESLLKAYLAMPNAADSKDLINSYVSFISDAVENKVLSLTDNREKLKAISEFGQYFDVFNKGKSDQLMTSTIQNILNTSENKKETIDMLTEVVLMKQLMPILAKVQLTDEELPELFYTLKLYVTSTDQKDAMQNIDFMLRVDKKANEGYSYTSLLKTALESEKHELAIEMVKKGFSLRENEKTAARAEDILKSNNVILRMLGYSYTDNDKLRMAIMLNAKENKKINLSNKPSPLYLAIETKQHDLAIALIEKGFELKKEELVIYQITKEKGGLGNMFRKQETLSKEDAKTETLAHIQLKKGSSMNK